MDLSAQGNVFGLDEDLSPDLSDMQRLEDPSVRHGVRDTGGRVTLAIHDCLKPVIAAINGAAIGIGATMTLAMDFRLASREARIGFVFGRLGIVPEACSSWFLPRLVGEQKALEWCLTADIMDVDEAARAGLLLSVHPDNDSLLAQARTLAHRIVDDRSPVAVALTRAMMRRNAALPHPVEAHRIDSLAMFYTSTGDGKAGVAAFREKRTPAFEARRLPCRRSTPGSDRRDRMLLNLLFGLAPATALVIVGAALFTAHVGRKVRRGFAPDGRFIDTRFGRLHVVDKGSGPPILLIHGLGGLTGNFTYGVLPRLATRFRVIAIDRLGCGHSDVLPAGFSGVKRHADVIAEAMDALAVERAVVVEHSMGGAVALALAASAPERVAALALIAPLTAIQHEPPALFRMLLVGQPWLRQLIGHTFATPLSIMRSATTLSALFGPEPVPKDYARAAGGSFRFVPGHMWPPRPTCSTPTTISPI